MADFNHLQIKLSSPFPCKTWKILVCVLHKIPHIVIYDITLCYSLACFALFCKLVFGCITLKKSQLT